MPYLLRELTGGKPPAWMSVPPGTTAGAGEKLVDEIPPDAVWDAASDKLRPVNDADRLATAKEAKRAEIARAFVAANTALYPETAPEYAIWLAVPEYAATPNGQRPQAVRANIARLRERLAAVETANTLAAVSAVAW